MIKKVLLGVAGILVLVAIIGSLSGGSNEPAATPVPQASRPTPTLAPTAPPTLAPTRTPIPPPTPTITDRPQSGQQKEEVLEYLLKVAPIIKDMSTAVNNFALIGDSDPTTAVGKAKIKAAISTFSREISSLVMDLAFLIPPRDAKAFHSCFSETLDLIGQATTKIEFALILENAEDMQDGANIMKAGQDKWGQCQTLFEELTKP